MSFDFSIDLSGTETELSDGAVTGGATASVDGGCKMKKFLHAAEIQGLKVCGGDIKLEGGMLYLQDGTNAMSLLKEVEMVFGVLSGSEFTPMDPDLKGIDNIEVSNEPTPGVNEVDDDSSYGSQTVSDSNQDAAVTGSGKWYLLIHRPGGQKVYKEMKAVNDLLTAAKVGTRVSSILGAMETVEDLQDAIRVAINAEGVAREADVDRLETKVDADIISLKTFLTALEDRLAKHADAGDAAVISYLDARMAELAQDMTDAYNDTRFHAEMQLSALSTASQECSEKFFGLASDKFVSRPLHEWNIDVSLVDTSDVLRGDIDVAFRIEEAVSDHDSDAGTPDMHLVTLLLDECGDGDSELAGYKVVVNAVYCGAAQPDIQHNEGEVDFVAPTFTPVALPLNSGDAADSDTPGTKIDATLLGN